MGSAGLPRADLFMSAEFRNVYEDAARAAAYARLEFPGTYALAYRDLTAILAEQVRGRRALGFGCGTRPLHVVLALAGLRGRPGRHPADAWGDHWLRCGVTQNVGKVHIDADILR